MRLLEIKKITGQCLLMLVGIDAFYYGGEKSTLADILFHSPMIYRRAALASAADRTSDNFGERCPIILEILNSRPWPHPQTGRGDHGSI